MNDGDRDERVRDLALQGALEAPRILHVFSTFAIGGPQLRSVDLIEALGPPYRHAILALDGRYQCRDRIQNNNLVEYPEREVAGASLIPRIRNARAIVRAIRPNLLLTYNWGAIEWALSNTLSPMCPHIHLEDGFRPEESERQLRRRVLFRRVALRGAKRLVVPSLALVEIARGIWRQPSSRILHIPNGIDFTRFQSAASRYRSEEADETRREIVIGTLAPLRPEKNLDLLLEVFAGLSGDFRCRLRIVGDGPERGRLEALAVRLGVARKVEFVGHVEQVERVLPAMDIFALTSRSEQMPISLLQAMASGLAVVATDVGDVKAMLAPENRSLVAPKGDRAALARHLARLLGDASLRARLGARNQSHAKTHHALTPMIQAYQDLFRSLLA